MRTTEITIERSESWVVRKSQNSFLAWCDCCGGEARMVTVDEAARVAGVGARSVYGWVEAGRVHFAETTDGRLYICLTSLVRSHDRFGESSDGEADGAAGDAARLFDARLKEV